MDATPLPGHWERLPYHWGSGSHFTSEAGPHGETVGDRYADAMSKRRELRIADGANLYGDDVTGRTVPEGHAPRHQREYDTGSACDGALSLARTARAPSSGRPSPFLQGVTKT